MSILHSEENKNKQNIKDDMTMMMKMILMTI